MTASHLSLLTNKGQIQDKGDNLHGTLAAPDKTCPIEDNQITQENLNCEVGVRY